MAYYTNLINAWNLSSASAVVPPGVTGESLFGLPTSAKLDILNDWTVLSTTERDDVEVKDVLVYLFTQNKYPQLKNYINTAPNTNAGIAAVQFLATFSIPTITEFQTSNTSLYTYTSTMLNAMAADVNTGITTTDVSNLLSFANHFDPWWYVNGYGGLISQNDLDAAQAQNNGVTLT